MYCLIFFQWTLNLMTVGFTLSFLAVLFLNLVNSYYQVNIKLGGMLL